MQPIAGENDILVGELMAAGHDTVIDVGPGLLEHALRRAALAGGNHPRVFSAGRD